VRFKKNCRNTDTFILGVFWGKIISPLPVLRLLLFVIGCDELLKCDELLSLRKVNKKWQELKICFDEVDFDAYWKDAELAKVWQ
jgi:hypothetical protein